MILYSAIKGDDIMKIKVMLKKFFYSKKVNETKIANLNDFIYIPTRQVLKDKPSDLILLDSYKKEYNQILSSKRIIVSRELELEELRNNSEMYTELLLNLINAEDLTTSFDNVSYYNAGTKRIDYISKMLKLKSYLYELEQLYLKTQLRIIALQEILNEKIFLSALKKNCIKEELNNLISTILTIKNRTVAIKLEIEKYLNNYSELNNAEFAFDEDTQIVVDKKCNELKEMISLLMPQKYKDFKKIENNIVNLVFMEKSLEEYIYNHKTYANNLKQIISDKILAIEKKSEIHESVSGVKDLELKLKAFSLYGHNLITDDDIKDFCTIKFTSLTNNIITILNFDFTKDTCHFEIECYIDIISKKISDILTGKNRYWNEIFHNNNKITKNFLLFLKSGHDNLDYWNILTSPDLIGLIVAFDKENGLREYFKNIYKSKNDFPQINFHENVYQHIKQIPSDDNNIYYFRTKIKTNDDENTPYIRTKFKTSEKKFFEFTDILPLETIFRMAYYNGEDIQDSLYILFKTMFSQIESKDSTFSLPEGLISINIPKSDMSEADMKIIKLFNNLTTNKNFETPPSLVEINGPLLKDVSLNNIFLNEGLKEVSHETFSGLIAKSMHIPNSLIKIDKSAFYEAKIYELFFNNFVDWDLNNTNRSILLNIIQNFFFATEIGCEKYYKVPDYIREKQRLYMEGKYSTFVNSELYARDTIYQDYEFKLKNCSRITIENNGIAFITLTSDNIKVTITRDVNYMRYRLRNTNNEEENMVSSLTYYEANTIYSYLLNSIKETYEESKKKVLDKK